MIVVEIRGVKLSLCQVRNRSVQTGGSMGHRNLLATSFIKYFNDKTVVIKVMGDSLIIHEFAYSLFIGLCSVTNDMLGYSHWYHSIKLIHCGAPQRDVLSDKMVL